MIAFGNNDSIRGKLLMNVRERVKLIAGPYSPPKLKRGDRAFCIYRDADVLITGWSDARIPWPRCRVVGKRGGYGLLLDEELARAVRTESSAAIQHWWGVSETTVWEWRKALGIEQWGTPGSQRLHRNVSLAGADILRGKPLARKATEARRERAIRMNLGRFLRRYYEENVRWKRHELALLGKLPDVEVAARIGRSENAVRVRRTKLGIKTACDRRK